MKKFLLSLAAVALGFAAYAETVTYTCSTLGSANINPLASVTVGEVTFSLDKGTGGTAPAYYSNGNDIRLYANNVMTVTASEGYKVDKLVFTLSNVAQLGTVTPSLGTVTEATGETTLTWEGSASRFNMTVSAKADFGSDQTKAGQFRFSAVEVTYSAGQGDVTPETPDTPAELYTVAEALSIIASGNIPTANVQVKGVISEITEISTSYGNATYTIKDALTDETGLLVYRGYWMNGDKFTSANQLAVGGTVVVEGVLVNFENKDGSFTPEFTTGNKVVSYTAPEGGDTPSIPETPTGIITVAEALAIINSGNIPADAVQVKGIISEISEMSNTDSGSTFGNASYTIKDALTDANGLLIFRGYWIDGAKFTTGTEIAVGGTVVVEGKLVNYNGTLEMTSGSKVISYTAGEGGDVPTPPTPDEPTGDSVTFNFNDITTLNPAYDPNAAGEFDLTDVTLYAEMITLESTATADASSKPRLFLSTGNNPTWSFRFYKDNTITIASDDSDYVITAVVFNGTNLNNTSIVFSDNGTFANNTWTPTSESGAEYMTVTKTATGNNPAINTIVVYYADAAGIEDVAAESAPVEFFNLQGVRVLNPENGIYIRRQGNTVTKVLVK